MLNDSFPCGNLVFHDVQPDAQLPTPAGWETYLDAYQKERLEPDLGLGDALQFEHINFGTPLRSADFHGKKKVKDETVPGSWATLLRSVGIDGAKARKILSISSLGKMNSYLSSWRNLCSTLPTPARTRETPAKPFHHP